MLDKLDERFKNVGKTAQKFNGAVGNVGKIADSAGKGAAKAAKRFGEFGSSLARIAKYRILRTIIKELGDAFREGLSNAYQFSKGIGGELAAAMDKMSTKSLTMKNQLGSAFGELLQIIMPIVLRIIELVRSAANAITQLFAAFRGNGTYMKAVDASKEWAKSTAGGAKAAKEWRNQLMGFDVINRLDAPEEPSGGGGSGDAVDYSKMFEMADVDSKFSKIKEKLEEILPYIKAIGLGLGAWSVTKFLMDLTGVTDKVMGADGGFRKLFGVFLAIIGIAGEVYFWIDALKNGLNEDNLTGMVIFAIPLILGLGLAFGTVGTAIGFLVAGIALFSAGLIDWIKTGELSNEALTAMELGILGVGIAISLLTKGPIPLIVAAVAMLALLIYKNWDKISEFVRDKVDKISTWFQGVCDKVNEWAQGVADGIDAAFDGAINWIVGVINNAIAWINTVLDGIGFLVRLLDKNASVQHIPTIQMGDGQAFASGGFPEDGMFFANHNELIGQFSNGQTAVANNTQIIEGIRQGVYDAMVAANNGKRNDVNVYLDGKQLSSAISRNQRNTERATGVAYA